MEKKGVGVNGNLIPPVKGEVRNPAGKPKGTRHRSTIVRELLELAKNPEFEKALAASGLDDKSKTIADQLTLCLIIKAASGDVSAYKELMDSGYGKNPDKTELTGADGDAIKSTMEVITAADAARAYEEALRDD